MKLRDRAKTLTQTRAFGLVLGFTALVLAYVFISWAIDSGSLLDYAITLLLLFIGIRELILSIFRSRKIR